MGHVQLTYGGLVLVFFMIVVTFLYHKFFGIDKLSKKGRLSFAVILIIATIILAVFLSYLFPGLDT